MDDHTEWHRGRREYTAWIIELEREEIIDQVEAARKHLSGFLLDHYQRQPHITLFVCGFLADDPRYGDDYCQHELEIHRQLLTDSGISPFSIEIGGLNSFAAAPFLEVRDREGGIERVRALLSSTATEIARSTFTPHVTVGLYSGTFPSKMVCERIATFSPRPVSLVIKQITFAAYRASEISGPLVYKHRAVLSKK
ncbi:MAG TPA: 2'-5' RNA ligase family protein [Nitrospirota bacterium]|nr:2'-5' RNA ligase family protein [Nitrospirota bacterium]